MLKVGNLCCECFVMKNVILPSYDETEAARLLPRDRNAVARLGNVVESELESQQQISHSQRTSNLATLMHLLKGNIGTGILAMPNAVSNAGLLVGSIGIPILGVICVHCMHLLVISSKTLARKIGCTSLDYSGTAEQAFRLGPARIQKYALVARHAVNTMLMLTQFGFCCVYFLFVSKSLYEVCKNLIGYSPIGPKAYMGILLPFMILFNFIRNLKKLSPASTLANVLQSVGLVMVLYYLLQGHQSTNLDVYTTSVSKLPLYFGTAMYAFEGIGVVLPLENAMATPEDFGGLNGVLNTGMVIVACLYTGVGFYGYLKYGNDVKSSITFNLPQNALSEVIRLMFALAIFLSYALQLYVPLTIIWPFLKSKFDIERFSQRDQLIMELLLRTVLVIITCFCKITYCCKCVFWWRHSILQNSLPWQHFVLCALVLKGLILIIANAALIVIAAITVAISIPMLDLFISLVGALASSSLALIFPPIIELCCIWNTNISRRKLCLVTIKNFLIACFGCIGCVIGTYTAVSEIVFCLQNPDDTKCAS